MRHVFRAIAIVIALAAAFDPSFTSMRRATPEVAVVSAGAAADDSLADRVARVLAKDYAVVRAPFARAAGTVIVGNRVPAGELARPVFAVFSDRDGPTVTLQAVETPDRPPAAGRVPVVAVARVTGARGRTLEATLRVGSLVVDRVTRTIAGDDVAERIPLAFVPTAPGTTPVRVTVAISGTRSSANGDVVISALARGWPVLFFSRQPSWMSTFVRRAIEHDPRFVVSSRTITSLKVSSVVGGGGLPRALESIGIADIYGTLVIGAPETLIDRDLETIKQLLRERGITVVLLFDQAADGRYGRLMDVASWGEATDAKGVDIEPVAGDSGALRASEYAWPTDLPEGAELLAQTAADAGTRRPVIWQSSVGAGRLIVSSAHDAWRFRDTSTSAFDAFWRRVIARAAADAPSRIDAAIAQPLLMPGERTHVSMLARDAALFSFATDTSVRAPFSATVEAGSTRDSMNLWPGTIVGEARGTFRAPSTPGNYHVAFSFGGLPIDVPFVVSTDVARVAPDERELVSAWVSAHGGTSRPAAQLDQVIADMQRAVRAEPRRDTWHPMRSPWWIVPFTLALAAEWFIRRRRGFA